jgi:hypothetical protein
MTIYLYKKTHKNTGLQYLGQTSKKDPHKYPGSGVYWVRHLDKHGYEYDTEILKECQTKDEIKYWGKHFSELWDVVNDPAWANLKSEEGNGGKTRGMSGREHSEETKKKMSDAHKDKPSKRKGRSFGPVPARQGIPNSFKGKQHSEKSKQNMRVPKGPMAEEHKLLLSLATKGTPKGKQELLTCPHCNKIGGGSLIKRWHFNNCKSKLQ